MLGCHETVPFLAPHFINWGLFLPIRYIIWSLPDVSFLFKVWCSPVIHDEVSSGKKPRLWYLQIHWTFRRRGYGCSETGWLRGQTGLAGTLGSWQPRWDRRAGRPRSCTGVGLIPAAAGVGVTLLKNRSRSYMIYSTEVIKSHSMEDSLIFPYCLQQELVLP